MHPGAEQILLAFIAALLLVIATVLFATIYRRAAAVRRYRILDRNREQYGRQFREAIDRKASPAEFSPFTFPERSARWHAVEDVLSALVGEPRYEPAAVVLFDRLGYRAY
ncbi:MAG: hypothetical protein ACM3L8_06115, partial [Verrucomicrobiota bacterium]